MMNSRSICNENLVRFGVDDVINSGNPKLHENRPYLSAFFDKKGRHLANFHFWEKNAPGGDHGYTVLELESMKESIQDCIEHLNKEEVFTPTLFE